MDQSNIKKIVQQKTVPWLNRANKFADDELPVDTPRYVLDAREKLIRNDRDIEEKIRSYAPHAGVALDGVTEDSNLGGFPIIWLAISGMTAGGAYIANKWFKDSDAERAEFAKKQTARIEAEDTARSQGLNDQQISDAGEDAFLKADGSYTRTKLIKRVLTIGTIFGAGFLVLAIMKQVKK